MPKRGVSGGAKKANCYSNLDFSGRPRGAPTTALPRDANPGLRLPTPPVKYLPGGSTPPPSNNFKSHRVIYNSVFLHEKQPLWIPPCYIQFYFLMRFWNPSKTKRPEEFRIPGPKKRSPRKLIDEENLGSTGAPGPALPRDTNPGLGPHTPPVKYLPGGSTPPP